MGRGMKGSNGRRERTGISKGGQGLVEYGPVLERVCCR
jgi:hypothetical protein